MKRSICSLLTLILLLCAACAGAESTVSVNGRGDCYITAEVAYVSLGVQARNADVREAQQQVNNGISSIIDALILSGVDKESINTDNINIWMYTDYIDGDERSLYNASSTLTVRVNDPNMAGAVIDTAFSAGANTLNGITFSAENTEDAEKEALKLAVDDARMKAETLAAAAGMKLIGIESITESYTSSYDSGANSFTMKEAVMDEAATVVHAAKLCVSAQITVVWKMTEAD